MPISFKQYGKERTGSSYLRTLIKKNFENVPIYHNTFGWKHGYPVPAIEWLSNNTKKGVVMSIYNTPEKYTHDELLPYAKSTPVPLISIKDPYSFVFSFKNFAAKKLEWSGVKVEKWCLDYNSKYYAWLDFSKDKPHSIVRYEDLIQDFSSVIDEISDTYGLKKKYVQPVGEVRVVHPATEHQIGYGGRFDSNLYKEKRYLDSMPGFVKGIVGKKIDWRLMERFGYEPI